MTSKRHGISREGSYEQTAKFSGEKFCCSLLLKTRVTKLEFEELLSQICYASDNNRFYL